MRQADDDRLLIQMGDHLGVRDVAPLQQTGLLRVGEHDLLLQYDEAAEPNLVQARLERGTVDPEQREGLWYRLLVSNFAWGANGLLGWSLTPEGNRVVFTAQHPFDPPCTGTALAAWLHNLVTCADAYWRRVPAQRPVAEIRLLRPLQRLTLPARPGAANGATLVDALCDQVGLTERPYLLGDGDLLSVDGSAMLLRHDLAAPGRVEVRLDLGMDMTMPRETLRQGLLWNNLVTGAGGRMLFSVHPERDAVVLALQQALPAKATGGELAELLHALAGRAKDCWDEVHPAISRAEAA